MASPPEPHELLTRALRAPPGLAATRAGWPGVADDSRPPPLRMVADGQAPGPAQPAISMQQQGSNGHLGALPLYGAHCPGAQDDAWARRGHLPPTPVPCGIPQASPHLLSAPAPRPADLAAAAASIAAPPPRADGNSGGSAGRSYNDWAPPPAADVQLQFLSHQMQALQLQLQAVIQRNFELEERLRRADRLAPVEDETDRAEDELSELSSTSAPHTQHSRGMHASMHAASDCISEEGTTTKLPPKFDKADLQRLRTKLTPSSVNRWMAEFQETLRDYSPLAAGLLKQSTELAQKRIAEIPSLAEVDRWAARQALNCFDREAPHVRLLLDVEEDGASSAVQTSAIALFSHLRRSNVAVNGEAARLRVAQFDTQEYFKAGDDESLTQLGATMLRDDFRALPAERTTPVHALERALLGKMPSAIKAQCDRLEDLLIEAEALDKAPPWTYSQLVRILAQYILAAKRRNSVALEAHHAYKEKEGVKSKCPCCGKAGHSARDCPSSCGSCKLRSCPGTYGGVCVFSTSSPLPSPLLNALGKPVPSKVRDWAVREHAKRHGSKRAHAAEITQTSTLADDIYAGSTEVVNMVHTADQVECMALATPMSTSDSVSAPIHVMLDGGANCNIFSHNAVSSFGRLLDAPPVEIAGWNQSSTRVDQHFQFTLSLVSTTSARLLFQITTGFSPAGRRNILSESALWDTHRWTVLKEPYMLLRTRDGDVPLIRLGGIYYVEAAIASSSSLTAASAEAHTLMINSLSVRRDGGPQVARLWAARMHANAQMLKKLIDATTGTSMVTLTPAMARVADQDTLIKRSNMRRKPVVSSSPADSKPTSPGQLFILDAFGPVSAPSVLGNAHYELEAVCAFSGYGYEILTTDVQQSTWLNFLSELFAAERALGHTVLTVRVDRVPNLSAATFKAALLSQLGLHLQVASNHEGVGAAEVRNDIKQRMAEADLMRSETTLGFLLCARKYAGWRLNRRPAHAASKSRLELHANRKPNLADPVPYLFGTECSVLVDEAERGPKGAGCHPGSTHKGRTQVGRFLGIEGHAYLVRLSNGTVTRARQVTPLNEYVLLTRGVPSGSLAAETATQTESSSDSAIVARVPQSIPNATPAPDTSPDTLLAGDGPPSLRTRSRAALAAMVEQCVAAAPLNSVEEIYDAALYQFCPEAYDSCSTHAHASLDEARVALLAFATTTPTLREVCKATSDIVQVETDAGVQEYRVPANHRQREAAPDALEWKAADELALQVLLRTPSRDGRFNRLVPVTLPQRLGQPIVPSVLQRRIKTDPVTRRLIKRKSRLCVAGDRQKALQMQTDTYTPRLAHADSADDLLIKMILANSAGTATTPAKRRVKIDIGNAYSRGIRQRPSSYMQLGVSLARKDDAGVELCLELNTPTYGEEPAGDDWGAIIAAQLYAQLPMHLVYWMTDRAGPLV